jgi:hypothetical protein
MALYFPGIFLVVFSVKRTSERRGHSAAVRISSIENPEISSEIEPVIFRLIVSIYVDV